MENATRLGEGNEFPTLFLTGVVSNDINYAFQTIGSDDAPGQWKIVFSWSKDFTFVCPTKTAAFSVREKEFSARDARLLGVSADSEFVHLAWRKGGAELNGLPFPMLADIKRELADSLGIPDEVEGVALRAMYIVDPDNTSASST